MFESGGITKLDLFQINVEKHNYEGHYFEYNLLTLDIGLYLALRMILLGIEFVFMILLRTE